MLRATSSAAQKAASHQLRSHHSAIVRPTASERGINHCLAAVNTAGPTVATAKAPISNGTKVSSFPLDRLLEWSVIGVSFEMPHDPRSTGPVRWISSLLTYL